MMGIKLLLCQAFCRRSRQHRGCESEQQRVFHDLSLVYCCLVRCKDKRLFSYLQVSVVFYVPTAMMMLVSGALVLVSRFETVSFSVRDYEFLRLRLSVSRLETVSFGLCEQARACPIASTPPLTGLKACP